APAVSGARSRDMIPRPHGVELELLCEMSEIVDLADGDLVSEIRNVECEFHREPTSSWKRTMWWAPRPSRCSAFLDAVEDVVPLVGVRLDGQHRDARVLGAFRIGKLLSFRDVHPLGLHDDGPLVAAHDVRRATLKHH